MHYIIISARWSPRVWQIGIPWRIHRRGAVASVREYAVGSIPASVASHGISFSAGRESRRVSAFVSVLSIASTSISIGPEGSIVIGGIGSSMRQITGQAIVIDSGIGQWTVWQPITVAISFPFRISSISVSVRIALWRIRLRIAISIPDTWIPISVYSAWIAISVTNYWVAVSIPFAVSIAIDTRTRWIPI